MCSYEYLPKIDFSTLSLLLFVLILTGDAVNACLFLVSLDTSS